MNDSSADAPALRVGSLGALMVIVGTLFSGPLGFLVISATAPQPAWSGPSVYAVHYHFIQTVPFYFGFLLIPGSILIVASIYRLAAGKTWALLALIFTAIGGAFIFFNYFMQTTYLPALVRDYSPALDPLITAFAVANPASIFWAIEMWGYGFIGVGTWLAARFFADRGVERAARIAFVVNGVLSVFGALWTSFDLAWVLSPAGLAAYTGWNVVYVVLAALTFAALRRRREAVRAA